MDVTTEFCQALGKYLTSPPPSDETGNLPTPLNASVAELTDALAQAHPARVHSALKKVIEQGGLEYTKGIRPEDYATNAVSSAIQAAAVDTKFDLKTWLEEHVKMGDPSSDSILAPAREIISQFVHSAAWEKRPDGRARAVFKTANQMETLPPGPYREALCTAVGTIFKSYGASVNSYNLPGFLEITASREANEKIQEAFAGSSQRQRGG